MEEPPKRKRGKPAKKSVLSPLFESERVLLDIGVACRQKLCATAKSRNMTMGDYMRLLIEADGDAITLPAEVSERLRRNTPNGATASMYAVHLITESLNRQGEF